MERHYIPPLPRSTDSRTDSSAHQCEPRARKFLKPYSTRNMTNQSALPSIFRKLSSLRLPEGLGGNCLGGAGGWGRVKEERDLPGFVPIQHGRVDAVHVGAGANKEQDDKEEGLEFENSEHDFVGLFLYEGLELCFSVLGCDLDNPLKAELSEYVRISVTNEFLGFMRLVW